MYRIKICGITRLQDALNSVKSGTDAIGLNFFSGSKRFIQFDKAKELITEFRETTKPNHTEIVGVFVNHSIKEIIDIATSLQLDAVQLHGEYQPEQAAGIPFPVYFVMGFEGDVQIKESGPLPKSFQKVVDAVREGAPIKGVLVDKKSGNQFGGTGEKLPWDDLDLSVLEKILGVPVILAGGLRPENVRQAIVQTHTRSIDVAGGVEESPGIKSETKIEQFCRSSLQAFGAK